MDLEAILTKARSARAPIVVTGQITDKGRERVAVLDTSGRTRVVVDEWLAAADVAPLAQALDAPVGSFDALHSTRWKYAWAAGRVWDARGLRARVVEPRVVEVRRIAGDFTAEASAAQFARIEVQRVRAAISDAWLVRSVIVVDGRNREHVVARKRELSVVIDPTYDGIDLMFDGSWAPQMARSLAGALGVELVVDDDLAR